MKKYLTIRGKTDGFGSQLMSKISGIVYCYHNPEIEYIHTPFKKIAHLKASIEDPASLEEFCGMYFGEKSITDFKKQKLDKRELESKKKVDEIVFSLNPDTNFSPAVKKMLRNKYLSTAKPKFSFLKQNKTNVCVHIRRGDVKASSTNRYANRYTNDEVYLNIIDKLLSRHENLYFHVFTNSNRVLTKFKKYSNLRLYSNLCLKKTFHAMTKADILIPAKSSFSYAAALLSTNKVIVDCMIPFVTKDKKPIYTPLNSWKRLLT